MKSKTLILMIVAIVCGLVASYMTSRVIADRQTPVEEEKVSVLVAKQNLNMGLLLKDPEKYFEEKQFTKGEEPKRAIKDFEELKGRLLNKPLSAEQFVTAEDLNDKGGEGLSGLMQKGKRAVAIKVNADTSVGGFVLPHNRVDIVSVTRKGDDLHSRIILQNILVLAVDQTSQRPEDKQATLSSTVTVEVTPAQAEKLSLASDLGSLRLILRSFGDDEKVTTAGASPKNLNSANDAVSDDQVVALEKVIERAKKSFFPKIPDVPPPPVKQTQVVKAPEPPPPPPPPPPPKTHTMTIFNGEQVTRAVFTLNDKESDIAIKIEKSQPESAPSGKQGPKPALGIKLPGLN
jgi:pilus assembly protein CpaB